MTDRLPLAFSMVAQLLVAIRGVFAAFLGLDDNNSE